MVDFLAAASAEAAAEAGKITRMKNQKIWFIFITVLLLLACSGGYVYWKYLRGIGPALRKPPADISKLIENQTPGANGTGFPLKLPPGFSISIFAKNLGGPRVLAWDSSGRLLVSVPDGGKVLALPDENTDGIADKVITVAEGLSKPHGLAMRCEGNAAVQQCKLYVGETNAVSVFDYEQGTPKATNRKKIITLPSGGGHVTRTLAIVPYQNTERVLVSIGSSCNVCNEADARRAAIYSANLDGSDFKPFATGLRNSVFMAPYPATGQIWATEMGRDLLGDDIPPDEVNIIREGQNYGWPICYGNNIHDTHFDKNVYIQDPCRDKTPSHIDLQAHSAPLGLAFIPEEGWPEDFKNDLLVAFHGSWNRSTPTGYKIVRIKLDGNGNPQGQEDFISGWLASGAKGGGALGRPVDILVQPGGYAYISDDKAGVIYRLTYTK